MNNVFGRMPPITQAQVGSLITFVVGQFIAYAVIDDATAKIVMSSVSTILPAVWMLGDSLLRGNRVHAEAAARIAGTTLHDDTTLSRKV